MFLQNSRVPASCLPGFKSRYTVSTGDTMYMLSQMFRVRLETLIAANQHITNPSRLFPGDVLCVPGLMTIPCSVVLNKQGRVPFGAGGAAYANFGPQGGQAVSVLATLPQPSVFGNYNGYFATALFREIGGFGNQLFGTPGDFPTWSTRIELPTVVQLTPDVQMIVQPFNTTTGASGPVVLKNDFTSCEACLDTP